MALTLCYHFTDGIYSDWRVCVETYRVRRNKLEETFAKQQESVRKAIDIFSACSSGATAFSVSRARCGSMRIWHVSCGSAPLYTT